MANHFQLDTRGPALKERKKKQEEDALPKIQWRDPRKANSFQTNSFYGKLDILNFWARLLPMMIKHLGDTADYWKGGMIEDLESAGLLSDFAVDPMISDDTDWQSSTFAHYQKLLRINKSQIIVHRKSLQKNRREYLNEITHRGDLFFDPNTGIRTSRGKPKEHYLLPVEIKHAVGHNSNRLVFVYQHASRELLGKRIIDVFNHVRKENPQIACCSYEAGNAAMVYFSISTSRIKGIYDRYFKISADSKSICRSQLLLSRESFCNC